MTICKKEKTNDILLMKEFFFIYKNLINIKFLKKLLICLNKK